MGEGTFHAQTLSPALEEGCKMSRLHYLIPKIPSSSNRLDFLAPALSPLLPLPESLPHPCPSSQAFHLVSPEAGGPASCLACVAMRSHPQCGMVCSGGGLWPEELTAGFGAQAGASGARTWFVAAFPNTLKKGRLVRKE